MIPNKKAEELVSKFMDYSQYKLNTKHNMSNVESARQCALIAVDECIKSTKQLIHNYTKGDDKRYIDIYLSMSLSVAYWQEVKQEIINL